MNILTSYKSNKNVIYSCKYHVIWCTKYRRDLLKDDVENDLKSIVFDKAKTMGVDVIELEVMPDHIHMLVDVDPQFGIHKFVKNIKAAYSRILRYMQATFHQGQQQGHELLLYPYKMLYNHQPYILLTLLLQYQPWQRLI